MRDVAKPVAERVLSVSTAASWDFPEPRDSAVEVTLAVARTAHQAGAIRPKLEPNLVESLGSFQTFPLSLLPSFCAADC
jgi:hypothetical protein